MQIEKTKNGVQVCARLWHQSDSVLVSLEFTPRQLFALENLYSSLSKYKELFSGELEPVRLSVDLKPFAVTPADDEPEKAEDLELYTVCYLQLTENGYFYVTLHSEDDEEDYFGGDSAHISEFLQHLN